MAKVSDRWGLWLKSLTGGVYGQKVSRQVGFMVKKSQVGFMVEKSQTGGVYG